MGEAVTYSMDGAIAIVMVDNPPVNAMDRSVRAGLQRVFLELRDRQDVKTACTR